ncbi:hypothetical protein GT370_07310 [Acidocella sp. MX-AZ03]|nr:hypothetical protein [Acidocella sp. MX-AZ03]WBO60571.1 hypothetical protein GT370_07310 [Acidocella sp. MX-AZ03]
MMAMEIAALLAGIRPVEPIQYARVWVFRHSTGQEPDRDNFNAACKGLLDVLQPSTAKRSYGLGVIENDKPGRCDLRIHHVHAKHSTQQMTRVIITEIDAAEIDAVRAAVAKEAEQAASLIGVHGAPLGLDKDASAKALAAA